MSQELHFVLFLKNDLRSGDSYFSGQLDAPDLIENHYINAAWLNQCNCALANKPNHEIRSLFFDPIIPRAAYVSKSLRFFIWNLFFSSLVYTQKRKKALFMVPIFFSLSFFAYDTETDDCVWFALIH